MVPDTAIPDTSKLDVAISEAGANDGPAKVNCPAPAIKPGDTTMTVQVGGTSRSYVLHIPAKYDGGKPAPLILDFHGIATSGSFQRDNSPYPTHTDPEGVVMAFPSGLSGPMGTAWSVGPCCVDGGVDDVLFAKQVVAQVQTTACIDPKRIYAVGFSMGGGMAYHLACHAADIFAAIAPAAFDLFKENVAGCIPARPISVIAFRGNADGLVPYGGGPSAVVPGMPVNMLGAKGTFQKWAELNQCSGSASGEDSNGCSSYPNCKGGVEVILCTKQGGGQESGNPAIAWPMLKRHSLP
jgi:polyhydroxybutyrate depolymerase